MKVFPFEDRVLVLPREQSDKIEGSLLIRPGTVKATTRIGIVAAQGPGRLIDNGTRIKPSVKEDDEVRNLKVGDIVMYLEGYGVPLKVQGEEHVLLDSRDLLAIMTTSESDEELMKQMELKYD